MRGPVVVDGVSESLASSKSEVRSGAWPRVGRVWLHPAARPTRAGGSVYHPGLKGGEVGWHGLRDIMKTE